MKPADLELSLFDEVAEILRAIVPGELGELRLQPRRYGIKAWFDSEQPTKEHYEAQVISADAVAGATVVALEIGFHAEHPKVADNDSTIARLRAHERRWRKTVGADAAVGEFLGRAQVWRRISETWADPDLSDSEIAFEIGARLADYVTALEPLRRDRS